LKVFEFSTDRRGYLEGLEGVSACFLDRREPLTSYLSSVPPYFSGALFLDRGGLSLLKDKVAKLTDGAEVDDVAVRDEDMLR
jgi:hypothetical protein